MRHYGADSWKPTCLWSNSCHIRYLDCGPLNHEQKLTSRPLAHVYMDAAGKKRCVGKKGILKDSQHLGSKSSMFCKFSNSILPLQKYSLGGTLWPRIISVFGPCQQQDLHEWVWVQTGRTISEYARRNLGFACSEGLNLVKVKLFVSKHDI